MTTDKQIEIKERNDPFWNEPEKREPTFLELLFTVVKPKENGEQPTTEKPL